MAMKYNRVLFYGYSSELMSETAKTLAVENKWLFNEIDSSDILVKFMHTD
jgi:SpoVK/Ycf46/Vps4 family AAA+-type ATPase